MAILRGIIRNLVMLQDVTNQLRIAIEKTTATTAIVFFQKGGGPSLVPWCASPTLVTNTNYDKYLKNHWLVVSTYPSEK